jgi:RNA polymerase-interacting CarD/CdnL/TRCF family regulator
LLQEAVPAKEAEEVPTGPEFQVGDFLIYGGHGLCVLSGYKEIEFAGIKDRCTEIRKVDELNTSISIPQSKWAKADIAPPPDLAVIEEVFALLAGKPEQLNGLWKHKETRFKELLNSSDILETAQAIHLILSKHRGHKLNPKKLIDTVPKEITMSYSERSIVIEAVDQLVKILSFRCGLSQNQAKDCLYRAALTPSFVNDLKLEDTTNGKRGLSRKEFVAIFGETRREARAVKDSLLIAGEAHVPEKPKPSYPSTASYAAPVTAPKTRTLRVRTGRTANETTRDADSTGRRVRVLPVNEKSYEDLQDKLLKSGHFKVVFNLAARTLSSNVDFVIATKLWLASREHRLTHADVREKLKLSEEDYSKKLKTIIDKLRTAAANENVKAIDKIIFHVEDKAASEKGGPANPVPDHNQEAYNELQEKLSATPHFRAVFNLAARTLERTEDFKIAANLWLVGRGNRKSHAQIREEFKIEESVYEERVKTIADKLKIAAAEKELKAIDKVSFHFADNAKKDKTPANPVPEHNVDAYNQLKEELSTVAHFKVVFNLAARALDNAEDFKIASRLWLVARDSRSTHAKIREEYKIEEADYSVRVKAIADKLKTAAKERDIKSIENINFHFEDSVKKPPRAPRENMTRTINIMNEGKSYSVRVHIPVSELEALDGSDLTVKKDEQTGEFTLQTAKRADPACKIG